MSSHEEQKTIERKLEAFITLKATGVENSYINDNIKHYANKYHEVTGDWYRRKHDKSTIVKPLSPQEVEYWERFDSCTLQKTIVGGKE